MSLAERTPARPRPRIGRYQITGRIGRGGMGMVYRGLDEALEREVAVKTLTVEGTLDEESRRRFEIEAKAAARLQHPNIVTVFELGEDRGIPFIAMELLPGVDLEALVRSGEPLLLQEKLEVAIQVLRGLGFAHERGIVHRDIKPSNIRLLDDGTAKIMDFGIAKLGATGVTRTGMMVGTVYYMSPEQIRGQRLDGRSDLFSVGVILHELLSGRRPFAGQNSTEVLFKIVNQPHPPLPDLPEAGPRLGAIVDRALAKDPAARHANASQMADELSGLLSSLAPAQSAANTVALEQGRRLLREGRLDDSVRRLREALELQPESIEARRALRTATRELQRRARAHEPEADQYPELEATFQASPTRREPETVVLPPAATAPGALPSRAGRWLLVAAGLGLAAAVAAGAILLLGEPPAPVCVPIKSRPPGAVVLLDGQPTGVSTDAELTLPPDTAEAVLTFRLPGYREQTRSLRLPLPPGTVVEAVLDPEPLTLPVSSEPAGAHVVLDGRTLEGVTPLELSIDPNLDHVLGISLEGHKSQELRLDPGRLPGELRVRLEPVGPPGHVAVVSGYPIDVIWEGQTLARGQQSPRVSLPPGRQVLELVSKVYFLSQRVTVGVRSGGDVRVETPGAGRVSIRAVPDTCQVFIGGLFVDYPPILERPIAAGTHRVTFRWPDGTKREQTAEITQGGIAYVTGRRD